MKSGFGYKRLIDATRLINLIKQKDYLIYNDFGGESRGMTTEDIVELINNEPECNSLGISFEDLEAELPRDLLYPFDSGACDECSSSHFYDGDTHCSAYQKRCPSVRGCEKYKACDTGGIQ